MNIPTYPARPVNGGPLDRARPKHGRWLYEPKINGWRALVHTPTGAMFNRHGKRLSIETAFAPVLDRLRDWHRGWPVCEWLDCEALERRLPIGKGSLVLLDLPLHGGTYDERMQMIYDDLIEGSGIAHSWPHEQFPPMENELLTFAYVYGEERLSAATGEWSGSPATDDPDNTWIDDHTGERVSAITGKRTDMHPLAAWKRLQAVNKALGCELFEGLVAKRRDSRYPVQLRRADEEFPGWMKHRWAF